MKRKPRESAVESRVLRALGLALGPVRPSAAFRRHLSGNLELAARHKATGEPIIEAPALLSRSAVIVAGIIGLIAAMVAVVVYLWEGHRRESHSSATG